MEEVLGQLLELIGIQMDGLGSHGTIPWTTPHLITEWVLTANMILHWPNVL